MKSYYLTLKVIALSFRLIFLEDCLNQWWNRRKRNQLLKEIVSSTNSTFLFLSFTQMSINRKWWSHLKLFLWNHVSIYYLLLIGVPIKIQSSYSFICLFKLRNLLSDLLTKKILKNFIKFMRRILSIKPFSNILFWNHNKMLRRHNFSRFGRILLNSTLSSFQV